MIEIQLNTGAFRLSALLGNFPDQLYFATVAIIINPQQISHLTVHSTGAQDINSQ